MYIIFILLVGLVVYGAIKYSKPKSSIRQMPENWKTILEKEVAFYHRLDEEEKTDFRNRMMTFLGEVNIDTVGFEKEELDEIFVAASAVIPVFGFRQWHYNNLSSVILYPNHFNKELEFHNEAEGRTIAGLVGTGKFEHQMILSRKALYHGFQNKTDKTNTAIHEFVHLIDKMDGDTDGLPKILMQEQMAVPWLALIHHEMEEINKDESDIRHYGGTSQTEFFAVASEYFFERPKLMKRKHPELYHMLEECFNAEEYDA